MEGAIHARTLWAGPLELRLDEPLALAGGRPIALSAREFELLRELASRPDRIISRGELYSAVWRAPLRAGDRSVDVYVRKLRTKLYTALPGWRFIHTHVGFGYRFSPQPSHDVHTGSTAR